MHTELNELQRTMAGWPESAHTAAKFMTETYGPPSAVTPDYLCWGKTGPWKRTIIFRQEHPHDFPIHHTDVMQQWIDYKAPPEMYDDIAAFDGSVVLERTTGEMSARCDKEPANFLALNLAHEVATGKRSVPDARAKYAEQVAAMLEQRPAPYMEKLLFEVAAGGTGDADFLTPGMPAAPK